MHKYLQNKLPKKLSSFFTPVNAIHSRTTRLASSGLNLSLPLYRTEKLQRSYNLELGTTRDKNIVFYLD